MFDARHSTHNNRMDASNVTVVCALYVLAMGGSGLRPLGADRLGMTHRALIRN